MARLNGKITLVYYFFVVFTFFATPFFITNTAAPVVLVSARELHREQALARAQQRWSQRISDLENSNIDPELAMLGPFDPHAPWPLFPTQATPNESHRFASPSQTSTPSRTKSAPLNRITSPPEEYSDSYSLHRRYIEKRAVCPFVIQTTVLLYFASGAQTPYSSTTVAGPRSTGIPGDDIDGLPINVQDSPQNDGEGDHAGNEGHGANAALLAGIFSILALIILAFVLAAWWHYRKRKARKIAAAGQMEERKDAPTIVRYVGENLSAERVR